MNVGNLGCVREPLSLLPYVAVGFSKKNKDKKFIYELMICKYN